MNEQQNQTVTTNPDQDQRNGVAMAPDADDQPQQNQPPTRAEVDALRTAVVQLTTLFSKYASTIEARLLDLHEPDWKTIITSPEFKQWLASLPPEQQRAFNTTWDANHMAAQIREFRSQQDAATGKKNKSGRLERSIHPRGVEAPNGFISDDEAFSLGFRSVRGKKQS